VLKLNYMITTKFVSPVLKENGVIEICDPEGNYWYEKLRGKNETC
jgi:hypothetical protein